MRNFKKLQIRYLPFANKFHLKLEKDTIICQILNGMDEGRDAAGVSQNRVKAFKNKHISRC